jgi:putative flippase GtrA
MAVALLALLYGFPRSAVRRSDALKLFDRLPGYFVTAGFAAVVDIGGFWALASIGLTIALAAGVSFMVAAVVNYALSTRFVFRQPASLGGFGRFLSAAVVGLGINVGVTTLLAHQGLAPVLAKVAGVGSAFIVNYVLVTLLVFRRQDPD